MSVVSEYVRQKLRGFVEHRGIVIVYDPQRHYDALLGNDLDGVPVLRYEGSFFQLRHEADAALEGDQPGKVILYVPLRREEAGSALVELESAGCVLAPGQSPDQDISLITIAREALKPYLPEKVLQTILADVEAGRMGLADLDRMVRPPEVSPVLEAIYKTNAPGDIALRFLTEPEWDQEIERRNALSDLQGLLSAMYEMEEKADTPEKLRVLFARHLLLTELVTAIGQDVPSRLGGISTARRVIAQGACAQLVRIWRNRRDLQESYVRLAREVEKQVHPEELDLSFDALRSLETFHGLDRALLRQVAAALAEHPDDELITLAEERRQGFWAEQDPEELQVAWALVRDAGRVLSVADHVETALQARKSWTLERLIFEYAIAESPWCLLDTVYRHLEHWAHSLDLAEGNPVLSLLAKARRRYFEVADKLALVTSRAWEQAKYQIPDVALQVHTFRDEVRPFTRGETRVAYLLVDALRYEMARELAERLREAAASDATSVVKEVGLHPTLAAVPTITKVGMAALMPGAEVSLELIASTGGKRTGIVPVIDGYPIRSREDRLERLQDAVYGVVPVLDDQELLRRKTRQESLKEARLIVVTVQGIDQIAESLSMAMAHRLIGDMLGQIQRILRALAELGVEHVVIAADHGFLFFGQEIDEGYKIDAPGGQTVELHRRVWVGQGGKQSPAYLYLTAEMLEIGSDLEFAFPKGLGIFRSAGGHSAYFHGGVSLQEWTIPVMHVSLTQTKPSMESQVIWDVRPTKDRITTRVFSVIVEGRSKGLFLQPTQVRMEARSGRTVVGSMVSASYGFDEAVKAVVMEPDTANEWSYRPNVLTLSLEEIPPDKVVWLHFLDAETGASLVDPIRVPVDIAI